MAKVAINGLGRLGRAWYDNEWGYAAQMVREAVRVTG